MVNRKKILAGEKYISIYPFFLKSNHSKKNMHLAEILIVSSFEYQIRFNMIFFNFFSRLILNYEAHRYTELVIPTNV